MRGLAVFLGVSLATFTPPERVVVDTVVRANIDVDLPTRLRDVTDVFVGAPYAVSPLGEGDGIDADPRIRFDAFDCTTFVETAMALALSSSLDDAAHTLDAIRYRQASPHFDNRRHFPGSEWIPELIHHGFLEDITRTVGGDDVVSVSKSLTKEAWARRKNRILDALAPDRVPFGVHHLDMWPLDKAIPNAARVPAGTVLSVVRVDYQSIPVRVSHQGLIVEKNGRRFMRHAADRMYHSVVDEPLEAFLVRISKYGKWPVAGVHLARVTRPPAHASAPASSTAVVPASTNAAAAPTQIAAPVNGAAVTPRRSE